MKKTFIFLTLGIAFLFALPSYATTVFFDNMESGTNGWTTTGFWHLETNPENNSISSELNPDLVSLPDNGALPSAYSGSNAWWYGESSNGTFIGTYDADLQTDKNGGFSSYSNFGTLISPAINLNSYSKATLSFWTWWEIEGVDVDRYDMMYVKASTDGINYTALDSINPINDVDGESYKPYSSGGLGQAGQWIKHTFSLNDYAGYSTVYIQFNFDTVDHRYNAFRGWLIDNVRVTNAGSANAKPSFSSTATGKQSCWGGGVSSSYLKGGEFQLLNAQTISIDVTNASGYWIEKNGTGGIVADGIDDGTVYLPAGHYYIYPGLDGNCLSAPIASDAYAEVSFNKASPLPNVIQKTGSTAIYGSNFNSNTEIYFMGPKSSTQALNETQATEVAVISDSKIEVTAPTLAEGTYNIKVQNGKKSKTLKNALTVSSENAPTISSVSPTTVSNDTTNSLAITGTNFSDSVKVTLGGFPCTSASVSSGTTISCTLPASIPYGYHNLVVENTDGQTDTEVGGIYVSNAITDETTYSAPGKTLYLNKKVKNVRAIKRNKKKLQIRWNKIKAAKAGYQIEVKKNSGKLVKRISTKASYKKNTRYVKGLKTGVRYKIRVRGINKNGYSGTFSKYLKVKTR